jgi:hypothetical protein
MIYLSMIYVYGLLTVFLSVDVGLAMLTNPTHIRSKWVMKRNRTLRERCGSFPITTYYHSCHYLNGRLMIT